MGWVGPQAPLIIAAKAHLQSNVSIRISWERPLYTLEERLFSASRIQKGPVDDLDTQKDHQD